MAEFCKECFMSVLGGTSKELKRAIMSDKPELCEGCGMIKPVVVCIKPTLATRWDNLGLKLRQKLNKK